MGDPGKLGASRMRRTRRTAATTTRRSTPSTPRAGTRHGSSSTASSATWRSWSPRRTPEPWSPGRRRSVASRLTTPTTADRSSLAQDAGSLGSGQGRQVGRRRVSAGVSNTSATLGDPSTSASRSASGCGGLGHVARGGVKHLAPCGSPRLARAPAGLPRFRRLGDLSRPGLGGGSACPAAATFRTELPSTSASPSPRGSVPSTATTSPRRSEKNASFAGVRCLSWSARPTRPSGPQPMYRCRPLPSSGSETMRNSLPAGGSGHGSPRGREHEVAHLERLLVQPGLARQGIEQRRRRPGSLGVAPVRRLHQRRAARLATGKAPGPRSRGPRAGLGHESSSREVSRSAGSSTTREPPGRSCAAARSSNAARSASADGPRPSSFSTCPRVMPSNAPSGSAPPFHGTGGERLLRLGRQRSGQRQGRRAPVGRGDLRGPGVQRGERHGAGPAAEVQHRARPPRQLPEHGARLRVAHRPVEEEVRPEQARVVQVPRADQRPVAGQPGRERPDALPDLLQLAPDQRRGSRGKLAVPPPDRHQARHPAGEGAVDVESGHGSPH